MQVSLDSRHLWISGFLSQGKTLLPSPCSGDRCAKVEATNCAGWCLGGTGCGDKAHVAMGQNLVPLVNIKIAGKWVFTPLTLIINDNNKF